MKNKRKHFWVGFMDGEIHIEPVTRAMQDNYGMLYQTREQARRYYQDVRKVEIREVRK